MTDNSPGTEQKVQFQIDYSSDDEEYERLFGEIRDGDYSSLKTVMRDRSFEQAGDKEMDLSLG